MSQKQLHHRYFEHVLALHSFWAFRTKRTFNTTLNSDFSRPSRLTTCMRSDYSISSPLSTTFVVSAVALQVILQGFIHYVSIGKKNGIVVYSTVCIEGQEHLRICLWILLTSEDDIDGVRARNSSGLPLITGTRHIFQLDDVVLGVLE